jgi:hypothetical protein
MRIRPLLASLALSALAVLAAASPAAGEPPPSPIVKLDGILKGVVLTPDGVFRWKPSEKPWGILGSLTGSTREFEEKTIEVGADRLMLTAPLRLAYETSRIKYEIERGEDTKIETKGDVVIMRTRRFSGQAIYMSAAKMVGRTPMYVRGSCETPKEEAGLIRLLTSVLAAKGAPEDLNGWLPSEVKVEWHANPASDMTLLDDGKASPEIVGQTMKIVRDAQGFVWRSLGVSASAAPYTPVVRCIGSRDLFQHLTGRGEVDAVHVAALGELLVAPRGAKLDVRAVANAAARQAYQFATGVADAEPIVTGLARLAESVALGEPAASLTPSDEGRAYDMVAAKKVRPWATLLKEGNFMTWSKDVDEMRRLEAELSVGYIVGSGSAQAKASLVAWVAGLKKFAHVEAASGGAYQALVPPKSDAEFWDYWKKRADAAAKKEKDKEKPKGK